MIDLGKDLNRTLRSTNVARYSGSSFGRTPVSAEEARIEEAFGASKRLAIYGSLAPGESNHGLIANVPGEYSDGFVHGELHAMGWGATIGFPAMRWNPSAAVFPVKLFVSEQLPHHWERLDRFEGEEYCRILVPVYDDARVIAVANIYEGRE